MKTFKLIALQVVEGDKLIDIDLIDGLIIDQESEQSTWLLEAYVSNSYDDYFKQLAARGNDLIVQVVITKKENNPAAFQVAITTIKHVNGHMSILFKGELKKTNNDYAEIVLKKLIEQGLTGEDLHREFKKIMRSKPLLTAAKRN